MDLYEAIEKRRDTRHFTNDEVPDEVLQKALMAAHKAPSVGLSEAVRFYVIRKPSIKQEIYWLFCNAQKKARAHIENDPFRFTQYNQLKLEGILESPLGLVVTTDYSVLQNFTIGVSGTTEAVQWSSICAVQNLWLSLTEQGYSMGWVSILDYQNLKRLLQLPAHEMPLGYFCIGKPATDYEQQPMLQLKNWKIKSANPVVIEVEGIFSSSGNNSDYQDHDFTNESTNAQNCNKLQHIINQKTKPLGALGRLEEIALQIGGIQNTTAPEIINPHVVVFAGDHGIAKTGLVNPYPQAVTAQMVKNFLNGGGAINVFCRQNELSLKVVDAGINHVWQPHEIAGGELINAKINFGTHNYMQGNAMTGEELNKAIETGKEVVAALADGNCNCVGFGEMGIGNTSSASLMMSVLLQQPLENCVGRGTGANDDQLAMKMDILKKVAAFHNLKELHEQPMELLIKIGGFEIAMMCGAYLQAAKEKMIIVVDGFIATAALLAAQAIGKNVIEYCVFAHSSDEKGHALMLESLKAKPLLNLGLRLGEGTGAALVMPLLRSAVAFVNQMASFENAGVSAK